MIDLTQVIESIEGLAYDILMWVLLIPKTLAKIIFHPAWVPGYVSEKFKDGVKGKFDDYLSPILLILLCSLIPFVYSYVTPQPNVTLSGPAQAQINQDATFTATANFISKADQYNYEWGEWIDNKYTSYGNWDSNQSTDYFAYNWNTPGWKTIDVTATDHQGEYYENQYDVYVVDPSVPLSEQGAPISAAPAAGRVTQNWQSALEGMPGFLAALAFLSIPLLFALAIEAFRGNPLTPASLMRSFYTQCYFLSPLALASWLLILGQKYFITPSELPLTIFAAIVVLVLLLQFFKSEILLIAAERRLHRRQAFWVFVGCFALILIVAVSIFFLMGNAEVFRQFLGWFYVAFVIILFLSGIWRSLFRKRPQKDEAKTE